MVDITHKNYTLREAMAQATVEVGKIETIYAIEQNTVPKGNVFEMSKAAALLAIKKTPELLPDTHPIPIESAKVSTEIDHCHLKIKITVSVKTIYKTGVEVEAMHGASVFALNVYDMLKPIDRDLKIKEIKLLDKKGGKRDFKDSFKENITAAIVVCSDSVSRGKKEDRAGKVIVSKLKQHHVTIADYKVIPDEPQKITEKVKHYQSNGINLIIFTGGTGLSKRDVTSETLKPLLDRNIPGVEEAIRKYGQDRTPYAMLSRSVAGTIKDTLVLALPGSTNGAKESMDAIFPSILHIFKISKGERHN